MAMILFLFVLFLVIAYIVSEGVKSIFKQIKGESKWD